MYMQRQREQANKQAKEETREKERVYQEHTNKEIQTRENKAC